MLLDAQGRGVGFGKVGADLPAELVLDDLYLAIDSEIVDRDESR